MIHLTLDQATLTVGDRLCGQLTYQAQAATQLPNTLPTKGAVELGWRTEGRGDRDHAIIQSQPLDLPALLNGRSIPFTFQIPPEGPITYDGLLFRVMWEITVSLTLPGLSRKKETVAHGFSVMAC
jgi:hypothetical protein